MLVCLIVIAALLHANTAAAQAGQPPALPHLAIEDSLGQDSPGMISSAPDRLAGLLAVRLTLASPEPGGELEQRLAAYRARKRPVWLALPAPGSVEGAEAWRVAIRRLLGRAGEGVAVLEVLLDRQDARLAGFAMRLAATEARALNESIRIAIGGRAVEDSASRATLFTSELAPYVDLIAISSAQAAAALDAVAAIDPTAAVAVTGLELPAERDRAVRHMLDTHLAAFGTRVVMHAWKASAFLDAGLRALAPLAPLMAGELTQLDTRAAGLRLSGGGRDVTESIRHRLLFDDETFATYFIYWGGQSSSPLRIQLTLPVEGTPAIHRLMDATRLTPAGYSRNPETGQVRLELPPADGPVLVDFNEGAVALYAERSDVSAERLLSVEEIIARHQQQQRVQDMLVRSYIATARMEQHFRPTMTDPGYDVVTENRYYVADDGIEWEEL